MRASPTSNTLRNFASCFVLFVFWFVAMGHQILIIEMRHYNTSFHHPFHYFDYSFNSGFLKTYLLCRLLPLCRHYCPLNADYPMCGDFSQCLLIPWSPSSRKTPGDCLLFRELVSRLESRRGRMERPPGPQYMDQNTHFSMPSSTECKNSYIAIHHSFPSQHLHRKPSNGLDS